MITTDQIIELFIHPRIYIDIEEILSWKPKLIEYMFNITFRFVKASSDDN